MIRWGCPAVGDCEGERWALYELVRVKLGIAGAVLAGWPS
jgi:hypothetical protein